MTSVVLDSSAVLAVLNSEAGADRVVAALGDALLSIINYTEVVSKLVERGVAIDRARTLVTTIGLPIAEFDLGLADRTGALRGETKEVGLSLGDRACLALAEREGVPALTGERRWTRVQTGVEIQLFR